MDTKETYLEKCYECDDIQFSTLTEEMITHCSTLDCQYHQLLQKYLTTFQTLSETCLVPNQNKKTSNLVE